MRKSPLERLMSHVRITPSACWEWTGYLDRHGYGTFFLNGSTGAHRASYILHKGPIPAGFHTDHLCRNPRCVNPAHLEAVTPRENTLRGVSFSAVNARKRTCIHGHPFNEGNTYLQGGRRRQCRRCNAGAVGRYKARKKTESFRPTSSIAMVVSSPGTKEAA